MINFGQPASRFIPPAQRQPNRNRFLGLFNQPVGYDVMGNPIYDQNQSTGSQQDLPALKKPYDPYERYSPVAPQQQQSIAPPEPQQPLPIRPFPGSPEPEQPPFDFASAYEKINKRPNRLAYQQAINQGPEQIKRSNWMKLLAAASAGASTLGGSDPIDASNAATYAYDAPQRRADAQYKERVAGLGNLSNMEDADIQERLKLLELQRSEQWKGEDLKLRKKEDARQQIETVLRQDAAVRDAKIDDATIKKMAYDLEHAGDRVRVNPVTGIEEIVQADGKVRVIGKTQLSQLEKTIFGAQEAGAKRTAENIADEPYEEKKRAATKELEEVRGANRIELEAARRETAVARIREKAATMPDGVAKNMILDLAREVAVGNLPANAESYLHFDENGTPTISGGVAGSSAVEATMRDWLARSLDKNRSGSAPSNETTSESNSGVTSSGVKYSITPIGNEGGSVTTPLRSQNAGKDTNLPAPNIPIGVGPQQNMSPNIPAPPAQNMSPNIREPIMSPASISPPKQQDDRSLIELEIAIDALKKARAQGALPAEIARLTQVVASARAKVQ